MTTRITGPTARAYLRALGQLGFEAAITGSWVVAGELPATRRRLMRAGVVTAAATAPARWTQPTPPVGTDRQTDPGRPGPGEPHRRSAAPVAGLRAFSVVTALGLATALTLGGRRLERRWLEHLARTGHRHPHRSLAVRIVALSVAGSLPARLAEAHAASRARS